MPNYNKGQFLEEAINSVINQTYKNWYLYIIDNHSVDNSLQIIKKFSNLIDLFRLIRTTNKDCFIYDIDFLNRSPFLSLFMKLFGARLIFHGHSNFPILKFEKDFANYIGKKYYGLQSI